MIMGKAALSFIAVIISPSRNPGAFFEKRAAMIKMMKCILLLLPCFAHAASDSNTVKRIYFNLYTDSIKTILNYYVNIEGEYSNGRILPLDTGTITIRADRGRMSGNEWIAPAHIDFEKVTFHAALKDNPAIDSEITVWLKRSKDPRDEDMELPVVPEDMQKRRGR